MRGQKIDDCLQSQQLFTNSYHTNPIGPADERIESYKATATHVV